MHNMDIRILILQRLITKLLNHIIEVFYPSYNRQVSRCPCMNLVHSFDSFRIPPQSVPGRVALLLTSYLVIINISSYSLSG